MNPIINSSFNKHPISLDIIHRRLRHPSDSVMKTMCHHQTLYGLPKHCPNKIHKSPCTICYTAKITTINKGPTVDTSNLQTEEIIHVDFVFYNVTSIRGFTSMITVLCAKIIMLWVFPNSSKRSHVRIIRFILATLLNEQHLYKRVRFDGDIPLENSTDVTNLLVDEFKISMENTGDYAFYLDVNNERHNRSIHNMVRAGRLYRN